MHGYPNINFEHPYFNNKSEAYADLNALLNMSGNQGSIDPYTALATGAPGNTSRNMEPRHVAIEDFGGRRRYAKASHSPVMAMPITSVGDGQYRGNSIGDAKVMNWRRTPEKRLKSALKSPLNVVTEGSEA